MNKLLYSPEALSDLDGIWMYIRVELQNITAPRQAVSRITETLEKLKNFAELGPKLSSITDIESDYRYLVCGKYIAFYRVTGGNVYVDRIIYGKRDYMNILFGDQDENAMN